MDDAKLIAAVVGIVSMIRGSMPRFDGWLVPFLAAIVSIAAVFAFAYDPSMVVVVRHGLQVAFAAVGGVSLVGYGVDRFGKVMAANTVTAAEDAAATKPAPPMFPLAEPSTKPAIPPVKP